MGSKVIRNITKVFKSASGVLFGRDTAGTGRGEELTPAQVRSLLSVYTISQTDTAISTAVNNLVAGAPGLLDTLDELSAALGDDANFASTITTALAGKVDSSTLNESIDDRVAALLVAGTNISLTYNDASGTLTIASTASGGSPGGSSGQVQFNNAGAFGGMTAVVYAATGTHVAITSQAAATIPLCVKGAASQSGNLTEWQTSAGTITLRVTSGFEINNPVGDLLLSGASAGTSATVIQQNGFSYFRLQPGTGILVSSSRIIGWTSNAFNINTSADTALARNAAGVVEVNNGTAGTFRDMIVRNLRMSAPTLVPASASATGSEGQIAWDSSYIYVCTATNTWKRVAIATW